MKRRDAIKQIMDVIDDELVVCNIGFPSRELYQIKDRPENFYMIGSMGLVSSIALGLAIAQPDKKVVAIDGDGAFFMNMGGLVTTSAKKPKNFTWIVIDNKAYGSTGNQETYSKDVDILSIAKGAGIEDAHNIADINLKEVINNDKCSFIVIDAEPGNFDAPIINMAPIEIKKRFMNKINE